MPRLVAHAAARALPLGLALRCPLVGLQLRRAMIVCLGGAAALVLAYAVARQTSLFALTEVEVVGAPAEVRREVRSTLEDLDGRSLVALDAAAVEGELRDLSSVFDAHVDRSFPHALRISVVPEQPLAVVRNGRAAWVVSRRGRVIRPMEAGAGHKLGLPNIWSTSGGDLAPGRHVSDPETAANLAVLVQVPTDFPVQIRAARSDGGGRTLVFGPRAELRLGTMDDLDLKFAAAGAVLSALPRGERQLLAYLDVSLPQRPVALDKSQVSSEG